MAATPQNYVLRDGATITLAGIQLLPEYQNKRIGSTLVEQLKREADLQRIPLRISVEKDNPHAQRFYKRLGCVVRDQDAQEYHLEYRSLDSDMSCKHIDNRAD